MDLIFAPHVDTELIGYCGYGWIIQGEGSEQEIFHDGSVLGFNSIISRYPARNTGIIVLSNNHFSGSSVYKVKDSINSILLGQDVELPVEKKAITLDTGVLDNFVGTYEIIPEMNFIITREGGHLYAQITGQEKLEIFAKSETEFFYRVADAQITFVKDQDGEIKGLILHEMGIDLPAKRMADTVVETADDKDIQQAA
jgi:hypothetical protein